MTFILKGNIIYNKDIKSLKVLENGYLICQNGFSRGAYCTIPDEFANYPMVDYGDKIIIPGLVDLHVHAPQYTFRGMGMDLQLLDWLNTYTFNEEANYSDLEYADKAYSYFVEDLRNGATSRAAIFSTIHLEATLLLMEKLEESGIVSFVGKVNMDRNSLPVLMAENATKSLEDTRYWILEALAKFKKSKPILTPRFIPSCTDELMEGLGQIQREYHLPVQSHLSESPEEIAWVKELYPTANCYGETYSKHGLIGEEVPTIMAHCVYSEGIEEDLLKENGVYVAHCPNSNTNLASGIAPIRRFIQRGIHVGLGSDVAGGTHTNIFRVMGDAIQMSKLYWRLVDGTQPPLTVPEALYLATVGGGKFFGMVGSFDEGYEFDALVIDDSSFVTPRLLTLENRLERIIYLADHHQVYAKYIQGRKVKEGYHEVNK